jgi:dihydrofolate reductase
MARIVVSENVSVDAVIQDPAGAEGFARGGWVGNVADRESVGRAALDDALGAAALLFGRRTYDFFAGRWPTRSGPLADRLNALPKYVVSSTLEQPGWKNSTVLGGDVVGEISRLKDAVDGDILALGSARLVQTLVEHDLVDELRLLVFPVVLGAGERLFGPTSDTTALLLTHARSDDGVAFLTYERPVVAPR